MSDSRKSSKKLQRLAFLVLAGVLVIFAVLALRPRTLREQATELMHAGLGGDSEALLRFAPPGEVEAGLSKEQLDSIWKKLVEPRLKRYKQVGGIETELDGGGTHAFAFQNLLATNGRTAAFGPNIWLGDDGGEAAVVQWLLTNAWRLEYVADGKPVGFRVGQRAALEGLRKDRTALEAIGVKGFFRQDSQKFYTWDELERLWQGRVNAPSNPREEKLRTAQPPQ